MAKPTIISRGCQYENCFSTIIFESSYMHCFFTDPLLFSDSLLELTLEHKEEYKISGHSSTISFKSGIYVASL